MGATPALLRNFCAIFRISLASTEPNPDVALACLVQLYGMPLIRDHAARRRYGNEVLELTRGHFEPFSAFVRELGGVVIMMQEFRHYFTNLHLSTQQLVDKHVSIKRWLWVAGALGIVGGSSAASAGVGQGLKTGSVRAGLVRAGERAAGYGNIAEGLESRIGGGLPKGAMRGAGFAVAAGATIAYAGGQQQITEIEAILRHRHQAGQVTLQQFAAVFGSAIPSQDVKRYWEMR